MQDSNLLDQPTTLEEALVTGWLDRHDDMQLAAVFDIDPGDAADLRDWIDRPRRPRPARGAARRDAIAESVGVVRNRTRMPGCRR